MKSHYDPRIGPALKVLTALKVALATDAALDTAKANVPSGYDPEIYCGVQEEDRDIAAIELLEALQDMTAEEFVRRRSTDE